jgi:hypothetical protein
MSWKFFQRAYKWISFWCTLAHGGLGEVLKSWFSLQYNTKKKQADCLKQPGEHVNGNSSLRIMSVFGSYPGLSAVAQATNAPKNCTVELQFFQKEVAACWFQTLPFI